jgi:hypothetical protein
MTSRVHTPSLSASTLRKLSLAIVCGPLLCSAHQAAFADELSTVRVERWIGQASAAQGLPVRVGCGADLAAQSGPWLLVSRSWGGSPHLRRYQLLRWSADAPPTATHIQVLWGQCAEQGPKSP